MHAPCVDRAHPQAAARRSSSVLAAWATRSRAGELGDTALGCGACRPRPPLHSLARRQVSGVSSHDTHRAYGQHARSDPRGAGMANPVPAGSDASAGTYRCTNCGYELDVGSTGNLPPCPSCENGGGKGERRRLRSRPLPRPEVGGAVHADLRRSVGRCQEQRQLSRGIREICGGSDRASRGESNRGEAGGAARALYPTRGDAVPSGPPRGRNPARVNRQVTAQTPASVLSSSRPSHGTRPLRSRLS